MCGLQWVAQQSTKQSAKHQKAVSHSVRAYIIRITSVYIGKKSKTSEIGRKKGVVRWAGIRPEAAHTHTHISGRAAPTLGYPAWRSAYHSGPTSCTLPGTLGTFRRIARSLPEASTRTVDAERHTMHAHQLYSSTLQKTDRGRFETCIALRMPFVSSLKLEL